MCAPGWDRTDEKIWGTYKYTAFSLNWKATTNPSLVPAFWNLNLRLETVEKYLDRHRADGHTRGMTSEIVNIAIDW